MTLHSLSSHSDARFDEDVRDIRGYRLWDPAGNTEAHVNELLVDGEGHVRYADVQCDGEHRVIPIGYLRVLPSRQMVALRGSNLGDLKNAPTYDPSSGTVGANREGEIEQYFDRLDDNDNAFDGPDYHGRGFRRGGKVDLLKRLDDYEVADGDPDPRGWRVVGRDGRTLGEVDHLVGDTGAMEVAFLVVDIDDDLLADDRLVLVPVGYVTLDTDDDNVELPLTSRTLLALPAYTEDDLTQDLISRTRKTLRSGRAEARYDSPRFRDESLSSDEKDMRVQRVEEELLVGKKQHEGAVVVQKTVEHEKAMAKETLREDHVEVKRMDAPKGTSPRTEIGADEIRIPVIREELVVAKKPVVQEVLVVKRSRGKRVETAQRKLAKERVQVKREGAARQDQV